MLLNSMLFHPRRRWIFILILVLLLFSSTTMYSSFNYTRKLITKRLEKEVVIQPVTHTFADKDDVQLLKHPSDLRYVESSSIQNITLILSTTVLDEVPPPVPASSTTTVLNQVSSTKKTNELTAKDVNVVASVVKHNNETAIPEKKDQESENTPVKDENKQRQEVKIPVRHPIIIPAGFTKDPVTYKKYKEYLARTEELLPLQTKAILIITNYRSGSSFFGELFNQHPDVFYIFEPLIVVSELDQCKTNMDQRVNILKQLSQCIVPDWAGIYKNLEPKYRVPKNRNIDICTYRRFCFAPFTKELNEGEHCLRANNTKVISPWQNCGTLNLNLISNICRRKKMVAIKLIRFCDILDLKEIVTELNIDLKVIHLIRDPRGIAYSRHALHRKMKLDAALNFTCSRQAKNVNNGLLNKPEWLNYKVFRYEDVALNPFHSAQAIYDFVGLQFNDSVKQWILENTGQPLPPEFKLPITTAVKTTVATKKKVALNPYGHKRDSKTVVDKWNRKIPFSEMKKIEAVCKPIMEQMGYLSVPSLSEYHSIDKKRYFTDQINL